jgi:hypothetical protein
MVAKAKTGAAAKLFRRQPPKRTRQGQGQHSKPYSGKRHRKLSQGQGHG